MLRTRPVACLLAKSFKAAPLPGISTTSGTRPSSSLPVIPTSPSPTCPCAETPDGLDIEREKDLNGSMAPYAQHVLISTGKSDWTSKIEDDGPGTDWGDFARSLKAMLGRGGKYSDPYNNIMITHSSFSPGLQASGFRAYLFPTFQRLFIPKHTPAVAEEILQTFLLPRTLNPMHAALSPAQKDVLTRRPMGPRSSRPYATRVIREPTVLICSHNSRDSRCGVMGPLLQEEFTRQLQNVGYEVPTEEGAITDGAAASSSEGTTASETTTAKAEAKANVALISHIGGHKWAGNVIVYIPPPWPSYTKRGAKPLGVTAATTAATGEPNPLAGCGVWYGRVEPRHVEGIVRETVLGGRIIRDLFRGGVDQDGGVLRLPLELAAKARNVEGRVGTMMPD